jgi:predicted SAM-dependent methyltransferase
MKLHLGCGSKFIPGYTHIDIIPYEHIDHVSSIDSLSFIQNDSVEVIYNCHVLEHFKRQQTKSVLTEWFRILKPRGVLRISVPDFESICKVYQETKNLNLVIGPLFGGQTYLYNIHYNIFDFQSLIKQENIRTFKIILKFSIVI